MAVKLHAYAVIFFGQKSCLKMSLVGWNLKGGRFAAFQNLTVPGHVRCAGLLVGCSLWNFQSKTKFCRGNGTRVNRPDPRPHPLQVHHPKGTPPQHGEPLRGKQPRRPWPILAPIPVPPTPPKPTRLPGPAGAGLQRSSLRVHASRSPTKPLSRLEKQAV